MNGETASGTNAPDHKPCISEKPSEEKERQIIKDDVLKRTAAILQRIDELREEKEPKWEKWLNSPFFLAIITGIAINFITSQWQYRQGIAEKAKVRAEQMQDYKQKVLAEFSDAIEREIDLALAVKRRIFWMNSVSGDTNAIYKPDGRNYNETRERHETLQAQIYAGRMHDSLIAQVQSAFQNEDVVQNADKLQKIVDDMVDAKTDEDLKRSKRRFNEVLSALLKSMLKEIKEYGR